MSCPAPAFAQTAATIAGTVSDGSGKAIGSAHITISGPQSVNTQSGPDGSFAANVPAGSYAVTVSANGFQTSETDVTVAAGAVTLKVTLSSASLTTIGRVTSGTVALNTTASSNATLSSTAFTDQGQNTAVNILDQVPGVEVFRSNGGSNEPFANTSVSIRGAEPYETQVLIDGHPVNTFGNGADGFNASFISTQLLSDVQIEKGSGNQPNTIGNAVGGTVNFRTPQITAGPTGSFVTGTDTYNSFYYAGKFSDTFGKLGLLVGVARNVGPGYLTPQNIYGADNQYQPVGVPAYPNPATSQGPTNYTGVVNFAYPATSDYYNNSQLVKLAFNFSQDTSVQFTNYSTQTWVDETGNNIGYISAKIVPCIETGAAAAPTCTGPQDGNQNYTATPFLGLVGQTVKLNYYAAYPDTAETDNAPLYTGEFRTVIGPGTFLARYYAGSITRQVNQQAAPGYISPCYDPACEWDFTGFNFNYNDNGYPGEPYLEEFIDILHGFDAQYTLLFGQDSLVFGFDRHTDEAYENQFYNNYDSQATAYQLSPTVSSATFDTEQSMDYNVRANIQLTKGLQFQAAGYESSATYVGSRFDPRFGFVFTPMAGTAIRASWGSAYVAPYYNLVENTGIHGHVLYLPGGTFAPETSSGYDLGVDHRFGPATVVSADAYATTIFNRYGSFNVPISGPGYGSETIVTSQGQALNEGIELAVTHKPKAGFGYHVAGDLLRDYAYGQTLPNTTKNNNAIYGSGTNPEPLPANGVQLPGYPYMKVQGDLYYTLHDASYARFSVTGYGANNSFGQPGFALLSLQYSRPLLKDVTFNVGVNNLGGYNDGAVGGIWNGGYTYPGLDGSVGSTTFQPVEPRTVFFQLQYGSKPK
jgi:hypothetical protein